MSNKNKTILIISLVAAAILIPFIFSVIKNIRDFANVIYEDKTNKKINAKNIVVYNLKTKKNDTITFNKVNIINYWAYYCGPCIEEMPLLEIISANDSYKVSLVTKDSSDNTMKFIAKNKLNLNFYYYSDTSIFGYAEILPRTIIIKDSIIKADIYSKINKTEKEFISQIDSLCKY
jgi:thiol-disulfide isomerase/thioredoxin